MEEKKTYYTEVSRRATDKHLSENYEQIMLRVRKGKREKIKELAASQNMSSQAFILSLIDKEAERLNFDMTVPPTPSQIKHEKKL